MIKKSFIFFTFFIIIFCAHAQNEYVTRVLEYCPAPGQFINTLPNYNNGEDANVVLSRASEQLVGQLGTTNYICLGAWGGYVTVGFDHTIANVPGAMDFQVGGNPVAPGKTVNPYTTRPSEGTFSQDSLLTGSAEPGIIFVSRDENGDGLPNDTWYEIAGSEYAYTTDYSITYYRPASDKKPVMGIDCYGDTIYVRRNAFHQQPYYPQWVEADSIVCTGRLLPNNILPGTMTLITLNYGYADNHQNETEGSKINIDWAVDNNGQPAHLSGIDFVRIQTGVSQDGGAMGETSTEVTGVRDLHPTIHAENAVENVQSDNSTAIKYFRNGQLIICRGNHEYTVFGHKIK